MTLNRGFIWVLVVSVTINLLLIGGKQKTTQQSNMSTPKLGNSSFNGAIKSALDQLRQAENHAATDGQALILEILVDLDVDTRRKAVKAMSQPRRHKANNRRLNSATK